MTAIHPLSSVKALPEFDIFGIPPTQGNIIQDLLTEHRPVSTLDSKTFIEFNLTSGIDEYIRLDKSFLYIRMRINLDEILKTPYTIESWKKVSTVNNLFTALFKQVEFIIGDRIVGTSHQTYPYKCDIERKLGRSKEAKQSFLSSELYFENNSSDPEGLIENISDIIKPLDDSTDFSIGKEFEMMGKINLPMFEQNKALLGGCNIKLRLIPNDPSFYLMMDNAIRLKSVDFTDASLFIHRSKVTRETLKGHFAGLEKGNARYPVRESFVVPVTINAGTQDTIIDNIHNGQQPKRAFVVFVDHASFNGVFKNNPFNYKPMDVCHLVFYLDGLQCPERPFQPDFDRGLYLREYFSMFDSTNQDNNESCITISRENYTKGNVMFGVNFNPDLSSGCCSSGHVNPIKFGSLRMQVRFKKPLAKTITALIYLDYDTIIEIDKERNPSRLFH